MDKKIGIIGLGFLGGSMRKYFSEKGSELYLFDKKGTGSAEEVNRAEIIFVCVNTPFDEEKNFADLSYVMLAIESLKGEKIVVIRSTVPPGTTDMLQERFPQHRFLVNPEFLRAASAYDDFIKPPRQVIGVTSNSEGLGEEILALLPKAPPEFTKILPARAAELIKYAANTILAAKVSLGNKIYDLAQALHLDYNEIQPLLGADPRVGTYGLNIMYEGFRGYNGTCFPKDVRTLIAFGEKNGVDMKWLKDMDDENLSLLRGQGQDPNYGHPGALPENKVL